MTPRGVAHTFVGLDRLVLRGGGVYHGGLLVSDGVSAARAVVYDGVDATGERIDYFYAYDEYRDMHYLDSGIALRTGLYIDLLTDDFNLTVYYQPAPRERG